MGLKTQNIAGGGNPNRRALDFYPTPPEATQALIDFFKKEGFSFGKVWEPACGNGAMVDVFRANGIECIGTDIQDGSDFFATTPPFGTYSIVTNPPFKEAAGFIRKSYDEAEIVAMLLKCQYWHSVKRLELFKKITPTYILPLTWRPYFTGQGAPAMDVQWSVWIKGSNETQYIPLKKP